MDVDVRPEEETIGIDEGQFFEDLVEFTFKHLKNKNIIIRARSLLQLGYNEK